MQAIIKAASHSNSQMDRSQHTTQMHSSKPSRVQHLQQKKSCIKDNREHKRTEANYGDHSGDRIDIGDHYTCHSEPLRTSISTVTSSLNTNNAENDSESNFDDGSSCASDSAIGKTNYTIC